MLYEVNAQELRQTLLGSEAAYIQFALGAQAGDDLLPTPEFHLQMFRLFIDESIKRVCVACPRSHAKTTIAKIAVSRLIHGATSDMNIGYLSHSSPLATKALMDIRNLICSESMMAAFGVPKFIKEQLDRGEYSFQLNGHTFNMSSFGANSQIRGYNVNNRRIDVLLVDDLEDRQENESEVLFDKLKRWFFSDCIKALSPQGRLIMLGNIVNRNSIVNENCVSPKWASIKLSALKQDGTPLWPELNSFADLIAEYNEYASKGLAGQWCAEMLNDPVAANTLSIDLQRITRSPKVDPESSEHEYGFITIDPAISQAAWGHAQTMAVHCYYETPAPHWQIVDSRVAYGESPVALYAAMQDMCSKWNVSIVGFEAEAYQASLKSMFEYMDSVNDSSGLIAYVPLKTLKKSKASRIKSFVDLLYQGVYHLSDNDNLTITQLLAFDPTRKDNSDDLIDVEAYGCQMLEMHLEKIKQAKNRKLSKSGYSSELLQRIAAASSL